MLTPAERLEQVTLKIDRAKHHFAELQGDVQRFLDGDPYAVGFRVDPVTKRPVYFVGAVAPTPTTLPLITGDVIQNLMSALDHLAYQLVNGDTSDNPPTPKKIYFPIAIDEPRYEATKGGKLNGALPATISAIDALQPYKGGDPLLWSMQELNNIEKHRILLTVGSQAHGVDINEKLRRMMRAEAKPALANLPPVYVLPADKGFPLQEGFELFVDGPGEPMMAGMRFRFDVALHEVGTLENASLLSSVQTMIAKVEEVTNALKPLLR